MYIYAKTQLWVYQNRGYIGNGWGYVIYGTTNGKGLERDDLYSFEECIQFNPATFDPGSGVLLEEHNLD